jgi:hypothetical protein
VLDRSEIQDLCGSLGKSSNDNEEKQNGHTIPCFVILGTSYFFFFFACVEVQYNTIQYNTVQYNTPLK